MPQPTPQAVNLYNALMGRKIHCILEAWDEHKHIDISIPWAKIDIEVDGLQHYTNPEQIKADFERSWYSTMDDDFDTFHVPNMIIDQHLDQVADALAVVARSHYKAIKEKTSLWNRIKKLFIK
jgi:hypothetical protein